MKRFISKNIKNYKYQCQFVGSQSSFGPGNLFRLIYPSYRPCVSNLYRLIFLLTGMVIEPVMARLNNIQNVHKHIFSRYY